MKKCKHDYLLNNGPRCIDCLITERDRLKRDMEIMDAEILRLKAEVEAIRHNCFCTEKVMEGNRRLAKECDQVHDLNNQYVAERFKLKAKAEKLAGALSEILDPFKHDGCEVNWKECGNDYCCAQHMMNCEEAKAALEGEGI